MNWIDTLAHWQILAAIGLLLAISEIFVAGFVLLPIGIGFLLTSVVSVFTSNWIVLLLALAGFQIAIFWIFKTHLKRFHAKTRSYTNAEGMVGSECVVSEAIPKGGLGYVRLYGDSWAARSENGQAVPVGTRATIVKLDGIKVVIDPLS